MSGGKDVRTMNGGEDLDSTAKPPGNDPGKFGIGQMALQDINSIFPTKGNDVSNVAVEIAEERKRLKDAWAFSG